MPPKNIGNQEINPNFLEMAWYCLPHYYCVMSPKCYFSLEFYRNSP
jgi:hypothetical protein